MQLPDEAITFNYQSLLFQARPDEEWKPTLEVQSEHFLSQARLRAIIPQMIQIKGQVATERELADPPDQTRVTPLQQQQEDVLKKIEQALSTDR